jgi:hypothetical protein
MHGGNPTSASVILARLERRFPRDRRRAPTEADMRRLRKLLTATGGDVAELNDWAEAVRDTDDDQAAITAYLARREWRAMMAEKAEAEALERGSMRASHRIFRARNGSAPARGATASSETVAVAAEPTGFSAESELRPVRKGSKEEAFKSWFWDQQPRR